MRCSGLIVLFFMLMSVFGYTQTTVVKGRILDSYSGIAVPAVQVQILGHLQQVQSDSNGYFIISEIDLPAGEQIIQLSHHDYLTKKLRITVVEGKSIDLNPVLLEADLSVGEQQTGIISLTDYELDEEEESSQNISGLLQASKDVFLNAVAYDFSATFFKPRGLDNSHSKLLINGIVMNKLVSGRPLWSNWGGLNDLQRNIEYDRGTTPGDHDFGGANGSTHILMRPSQYKRGGRISYALANRSYEGRVMVSYSSGHTRSKWSYSVLISRRYGERGYVEGTPYDANSVFIAVERALNETHSLNLVGIYTPVQRGRSTALTEEVESLKGNSYNPHWGIQDGKIRSSRIRYIEEPIVMLNHYWKISEGNKINNNIAYQSGKIGNSRLDYGGRRNPLANYYQRLPSYFLRNPNPTPLDFQLAYEAEQEFINNGQLDWNSLYEANTKTAGGLSAYIVQEDVIRDTQLSMSSIYNGSLSENVRLDGGLSYRMLKSENYAEVNDLLGGQGYLDIDHFGEDTNFIQSDLQNPDRIVIAGERYKYNYEIKASNLTAFIQTRINLRRVDLYVTGGLSQVNYQRTGLFQNGYFAQPNRSLGDSESINFTAFSAKIGGLYKFNGRHFFELNAAMLAHPPTLRNSFVNPRQNNDIVDGLAIENTRLADASYLFRTPKVKARVSAFYNELSNRTEIGFYFTQNALGSEDNNAFVQEIVTGIGNRNIGLEIGAEVKIFPTFKIKTAASFGQYIYNSNPLLYLSGDDFDSDPLDGVVEGNDIEIVGGKRTVILENYHVAGGPERAAQIGLEYRDPKFWWAGITTNYFSNSYVDISYLRRTPDFYTDSDGLPFSNYDINTARALLKQEQLDDYFLVNVVGGKSWRIGGYYIGLFASINNLLDSRYRTGGFEDSRRVSYPQQLEERNRRYGPLFGNKYFFGNGTTYYANLYLRF